MISALLHHALPEDTYAFPKHRVSFLNGRPVLNETAQRWLKEGLRGGELEFLDQPWQEETYHSPPSPRAIDSGEEPPIQPDNLQAPVYDIQHMKLGPKNSYLCLITKPTDMVPSAEDKAEAEAEVTPVHSWSLLQPLSGRCLYHRQGWFTYSYCHNEKIRQFKELPHSHPHPPGGYTPEEDPEWESYTLGRAPLAPEPGADLTVAEQTALAANLELARGGGSRYLVQRWGDGTVCDKTGRKREVEVQFHCSMTVTDTILFVKEAKTCSYVLVIHTPRLCAVPGFKSRLDSHEEALIRCREIVDDEASVHANQESLPESDYPVKVPRRKPVLSAPAVAKGDDNVVPAPKTGEKEAYKDMVRRALEAIVGNNNDADFSRVIVEPIGENGELMIEFIDELPANEGEPEGRAGATHAGLAEALRAAGFDIKGEWETDPKKTRRNGEKNQKKGTKQTANTHDEL
jgi:protein OS-9